MRIMFPPICQQRVGTAGVNSIGIVLLISFFIGAVITMNKELNIESPFHASMDSGICNAVIMLEFSSSICVSDISGKRSGQYRFRLGTMRSPNRSTHWKSGCQFCQLSHPTKIFAMVTTIPLMVDVPVSLPRYHRAFCTCWFGGIMSAVDLEYGFNTCLSNGFIWCGIIKSLFFAFIIASVSAFFGYTVEGGFHPKWARRSTDSVVCSSVTYLIRRPEY